MPEADLARLYRDTRQRVAGLLGGMGGPALAANVPACPRWSVRDVLAAWAAIAPRFEELIGAARSWPGVIDVASHEQDIRGAVGQPGARDSDVVWHVAGYLLSRLRPPVPLRVVVEDAEFLIGPAGAGREEPVLGLRTTRFEAFRWRMGRRSRDQLAALGWSADPAPVIDHLVVFGPAACDVIE